LTAGVDVQLDRLEAQIIGWGYPLEAWSIHYEIIPGDPSKPEVWNRLDELLLRGFDYEEGNRFVISATCVDSGGGYTEAVYRFCRPRLARSVWAIKGSSWSRQGDPVWPPRKVQRRKDGGYKPVIIAVDSAKDQLRQMLLTDEAGPGFLHIPEDRSDAFLDQLVAEQCVFEKKAGATIRKWILPRGRANEAYDTLVYAYAALRGLEEERGLKLDRASTQLAHAITVASQPQEAKAPAPLVRPRVRHYRLPGD
jgi:phage terminase large subunit GpA-like protein